MGKDKKAAHERIRGKPCDRPTAKFGEFIMYIPLGSPATNGKKVVDKAHDGVWFGLVDRIGEHIIGSDHGVVKCRTTERRPIGQQWKGSCGSLSQALRKTGSPPASWDGQPLDFIDAKMRNKAPTRRPQSSNVSLIACAFPECNRPQDDVVARGAFFV